MYKVASTGKRVRAQGLRNDLRPIAYQEKGTDAHRENTGSMIRIYQKCLFFSFLCLICLPLTPFAHAQQTVQKLDPSTAIQDDKPQRLHVTDKLATLPEAQQALQDFQREKANRTAQKRSQENTATFQRPALGSRATFRVLADVATTPRWEEQSFTLSATSTVANIWVEDGELNNGNVSEDDISTLENAILQSTPDASIDPSSGIIENNNAYFGDPPNVDGDGVIDILLYDISEGGSDNQFFIAGFVTPSDLTASGGGNHKDVMYLDTNPGITSFPINSVLATAAHEYQHWIHYNYDLGEQSFINEGLSEWAEVLNGYNARNMTFLNSPFTYNVPLLGWETGDIIINDYERAGLFTGYLAERMPPASVASITRNPNRGKRGYDEALEAEGLVFEEVLKDYHTANLLNDATLDPAFLYTNPTYASVGTVPTRVTDGFFEDSTPISDTFIESGGVEYLVWNNVQDFTFSLDTFDRFDTIRERLAIRVLLEEKDGETRFEDLTLPQEEKYYAGAYDRITLIVMHVRAELTSRVGVFYEANWGQAFQGVLSEVIYDSGVVTDNIFFALGSDTDGAVATRFDLPPGQASIFEVSLAPYFLSQFPSSGVPNTSPRDLTLKVWDVADNGAPGDELFSLEVTDPRTTGTTSTTLKHFSIDMTPYADQLSNLPASVFIGYAEAGTDANYMVIGPSAYTVENRSYLILNSGTWDALWETQFSDGGDNDFPLENTIIPIRAVFLSDPNAVSSEDFPVTVGEFALEQNYPNPFQQQTTITYAVPEPGNVELVIYNVLGQQVETLVDQFQPSGNYSITFQSESLPSGLYLYTLSTGSHTKTRRMTIVR